MSRLTKRNGKYIEYSNENYNDSVDNYTMLDKCLQKLAEYEDLEEQGLLIKLPCKVGTVYWTFETPYWIDRKKCKGCECFYDYDEYDGSFCDKDEEYPKCTQIIEKVFLNNLEIVSLMNQFGETVFLTKEEAEKKLAEMKGGAE